MVPSSPASPTRRWRSDVRRTLTTSRQWTAQWAEEDGANPKRPEWLSEEELQVYIDAFERTGFTGGLNWYRNIDRNWELTAPYGERRIEQPAMFLTGELDLVRNFMPGRGDGRLGDRPARAAWSCPAPATGSSSRRPEAVNAALLGLPRRALGAPPGAQPDSQDASDARADLRAQRTPSHSTRSHGARASLHA